MKYSFYASDRNGKAVNIPGQAYNQSRSANYQKADQNTRAESLGSDKRDRILTALIKKALDRYKEDPEKIQEIRSKVEMYEINRTIAREYKSRSSEKNLTKELINYLTTL